MPVDTGLTDALLEKYFHLGWSNRRIAEEYGISVQAVSKRLTGMGLYRKPISRQVNEWLAIRWDIRAPKEGYGHHNSHAAQSLRYWLCMRLGDNDLSERQKRKAHKWVLGLQERNEVLCYDPDTPKGWYYRPRTAQDGQRVIDWPPGMPYPSEKFKRALDLPAQPAPEPV